MQPLRIGIVDLDTSHPGNWVPIIKELGHQVIAVFDGGTVHESGYASQFAKKHNINVICESLEEMAPIVDAVMIHSVDWDLHVERARPFVEAGKAVLIDKPMAGNIRDIRQLLEWERSGVRITGGSSLSVCEEAADWHRQQDPGDPIVTVLAGCSVDDFNYGIHAFYFLQAIMGPGIESVRSAGVHLQHQIELLWKDGRKGFLSVGATQGYLPFYATVVTEHTVKHLQADSSRLYRAFLEASLPYLAGEAGPAAAISQLLEAELAAVAARKSLSLGGQEVALKQLSDEDPGYEGAAFAAQYRMKAKGL
ncbi:Gfo/Idh/MocA family oxidoreductase [Paenibacillus sp. MWE-103]|uniref:Gfo/Idh/MocA family oxidoreductase n=1 Tax=Paenibacillus artemisiicola TaxID=1172618 RepID=A0ABS3W4E8_9BACL|nr:Gfo/Idh/MocA family oxidoreductase [Paenibacillus artemisiicola]MBO7743157.1 Gfo/Idh/MocA family oxidoreductase [Paenibacillus artemisiicola]